MQSILNNAIATDYLKYCGAPSWEKWHYLLLSITSASHTGISHQCGSQHSNFTGCKIWAVAIPTLFSTTTKIIRIQWYCCPGLSSHRTMCVIFTIFDLCLLYIPKTSNKTMFHTPCISALALSDGALLCFDIRTNTIPELSFTTSDVLIDRTDVILSTSIECIITLHQNALQRLAPVIQ